MDRSTIYIPTKFIHAVQKTKSLWSVEKDVLARTVFAIRVYTRIFYCYMARLLTSGMTTVCFRAFLSTSRGVFSPDCSRLTEALCAQLFARHSLRRRASEGSPSQSRERLVLADYMTVSARLHFASNEHQCVGLFLPKLNVTTISKW